MFRACIVTAKKKKFTKFCYLQSSFSLLTMGILIDNKYPLTNDELYRLELENFPLWWNFGAELITNLPSSLLHDFKHIAFGLSISVSIIENDACHWHLSFASNALLNVSMNNSSVLCMQRSNDSEWKNLFAWNRIFNTEFIKLFELQIYMKIKLNLLRKYLLAIISYEWNFSLEQSLWGHSQTTFI